MRAGIRFGLILSVAITLAPTAWAERYYAGGDFELATLKYDGINEKSKPNLLVMRGGWRAHPFVTTEIRYGFGLTDDDLQITRDQLNADLRASLGLPADDDLLENTSNTTAELSSFYGLYIRATLPTPSRMVPYLLLGYTQAEISATTALTDGTRAEQSIKDSDVSFGVGMELISDGPISMVAEYVQYVALENVKASAFNLGMHYNF